MARTIQQDITIRLDAGQVGEIEAMVQERLAGMADAPAIEKLRLDQYAGPWLVEEKRFADALAHIRGMNLMEHVRESRPPAGDAAGDGERRSYEVGDDGVAIVELSGFMTKYSGSFTTGTVAVARALRQADADAAVKGIVLRVDSGGGSASGVDDLAKTVAMLKKPVAAFVWGFAASAAYWVASQADHVVANESAYVGSIGVYSVVEDWSKAFEADGVKVHVIRAGKFKGAGTFGTEITEEQLAEWQRIVDGIHADFTAAIARGRGLKKTAVAELADGRIHRATDAKSLGLIDEVAQDDVAALASARRMALGGLKRQNVQTSKRRNSGGDGASAEEGIGPGGGEQETNMSAEQDKPAAGGNLETRDKGLETGKNQPATLKELKAALPRAGNDFLVECCEKDFTLLQAKDAYIERLEKNYEAKDAELKKAQAATAKGVETAPKKPGVAPVGNGGVAAGDAEDPKVAWNKAVQAKFDVCKDRAKAVAAVVREQPELHKAYLAASNPRKTG